jgi:hypothetical protein
MNQVHSKNRRGDKRMNTAKMRYGRAAALVLVGAPIMGIPGSSQAQKALKIDMVPKLWPS